MADKENATGFRDVVLPNLEALLHHSLTLTKNGRDAVELMSEAMAVALRSWDATVLEARHTDWLHNIVTSQFRDRFGMMERERKSISDPKDETAASGPDRLPMAAAADVWHSSFLASEWEDDVRYFEAIAELPEVFRATLILSYLDGISNRESTGLASSEGSTAELPLSEGRRFIREELYSLLIDHDGLGSGWDMEYTR